MPAPEISSRTQDCVLWAFSDFDDRGRYTVSAPIDIKVRWEETRREIRKPDGVLVAIEATAYVDRAIVPNSLMWLGTVATLPETSIFSDGVKQVVTYEDDPDIKGRAHQRTVTLARYHGGPPNLA